MNCEPKMSQMISSPPSLQIGEPVARSEGLPSRSPSKARRAAISFEEVGSRALDTSITSVKKPKAQSDSEEKLVLSFSAIGNQAIHDGHSNLSKHVVIDSKGGPKRFDDVKRDRSSSTYGVAPTSVVASRSVAVSEEGKSDHESRESLERKEKESSSPNILLEDSLSIAEESKNQQISQIDSWDQVDESLDKLQQKPVDGRVDAQSLPLEAYLLPSEVGGELSQAELEAKQKEEELERKREELARKTRVINTDHVEELDLLSQPSLSTEVGEALETESKAPSEPNHASINTPLQEVPEVAEPPLDECDKAPPPNRTVINTHPVMSRPEFNYGSELQAQTGILIPKLPTNRMTRASRDEIRSEASYSEAEDERESEKIHKRLSPPSKKILQFAEYLGMDMETDREYLWIAEECLYASLPKGWCQARDGVTNRYYYWSEEAPEKRQWEHPLDPLFRALFIQLKAEKNQREEELHGDDILLVSTQRKLQKKRLSLVRPLSARSDASGTLAKGIDLELLRQSFTSNEILEKIRDQERDKLQQKVPTPMDPPPKQGLMQALFSRSSSTKVIPSGDIPAQDPNENEGSPETVLTKEEKIKSMGISIALASIRLLPEMKPRPFPKRNVIDHSFLTEFATYIGIKLPRDANLMWIAKLAVLAPVPKDWRICSNEYTQETYYGSETTLEICKNHPLDQFFALLGNVSGNICT